MHLDCKNKRVLLRVDFNVPFNKETRIIRDDTRIRAALPTIETIIEKGGKIILLSHLGRPKGQANPLYSLKFIADYLRDILKEKNISVQFNDTPIGHPDLLHQTLHLKSRHILVLENIRFYPEEEKGDPTFARQLADLGDLYINDAFGCMHRNHASAATAAEYFDKAHKAFGLLAQSEIANAERVLQNPKSPFTAILGGAKVSDKLPILERLLDSARHIIIGGGMAYTFLKAQGQPIGDSLCDTERLDWVKKLSATAAEKGVTIHLPQDSIAADDFTNPTDIQEVTAIKDGYLGMDIGPKSRAAFSEVIAQSRTILWNGPMGVFEKTAFNEGTKHIARAVAEATEKGAFSLIGGGDSVAAVKGLGLEKNMSYISTGGGALLEFFEGKKLPGIAAMEA